MPLRLLGGGAIQTDKISLCLFQRRRLLGFAATCIVGSAPLALSFAGTSIRPSRQLFLCQRSTIRLPFIMPPSTTSLKSLTSDDQVSWTDMTVSELKSHLKGRSLPISGVKKDLIQRLEEHTSSSMHSSQPISSRTSKYFTQRNIQDSSQQKEPSLESKLSPAVTLIVKQLPSILPTEELPHGNSKEPRLPPLSPLRNW